MQRVRFLTSKLAVVHCEIEPTEKVGKRRRKVRAVTRFTMRKIRARWEITAARTREKRTRRKLSRTREKQVHARKSELVLARE
jgi:hypothetical protein